MAKQLTKYSACVLQVLLVFLTMNWTRLECLSDCTYIGIMVFIMKWITTAKWNFFSEPSSCLNIKE
jgi:hypothetical protein